MVYMKIIAKFFEIWTTIFLNFLMLILYNNNAKSLIVTKKLHDPAHISGNTHQNIGQDCANFL